MSIADRQQILVKIGALWMWRTYSVSFKKTAPIPCDWKYLCINIAEDGSKQSRNVQ